MWDQPFAARLAQIKHESGGDVPADLAAIIFMCAAVGEGRHPLLLTAFKMDPFVHCVRKVCSFLQLLHAACCMLLLYEGFWSWGLDKFFLLLGRCCRLLLE